MRVVSAEEDDDVRSSEPVKQGYSRSVLAAQDLLAQKAASTRTVAMRFGLLLILAMLVAAAVGIFLHSRQRPTLTEQDTGGAQRFRQHHRRARF